jgi:hypothetical protein
MTFRSIRGSLAVGLLSLTVVGFSACGKDEPAPAPKPTNTAPPAAPANANVAVTSPDDAAIKKSVEDNLTKEGVKNVTVAVKNKVVTLTGTVPAADLPKAVKAANDATPKPDKVENQLVKS